MALTKYVYSDLKYMNQLKKEEVLTKFHGVKIPITNKESMFLYFRKFPKSQVQNDNKQNKKQGFIKQKNFDTNNDDLLKGSKHKTYTNVLFNKPKTTKELKQNVSKKILNNFPSERSLIVVSLDKHYDNDEIKQIFQNFGKIRRVFFMKLQKQKNKKNIYFYILIFKNEKSLLECFDVEKFQWDLMKKYLPRFSSMKETEKEFLFQQYLKSIQNYANFEDYNEDEEIDEEGYITQKPYTFDYPEVFKDLKRKKKKDKVHNDYYEFNNKHKVNEEEIDSESDNQSQQSLDNNKLNDPEYLAKRKKLLKSQFAKLKKLKKEQLNVKEQYL